ncbi:hypothetical protein ACNTMW_25250 [Planosporangium sp. 12N6]|uniref:hypothetical protein n=1 Tax=Planosporangium spinosum TaxID=3402278 RepID=UPI003CF1EA55
MAFSNFVERSTTSVPHLVESSSDRGCDGGSIRCDAGSIVGSWRAIGGFSDAFDQWSPGARSVVSRRAIGGFLVRVAVERDQDAVPRLVLVSLLGAVDQVGQCGAEPFRLG